MKFMKSAITLSLLHVFIAFMALPAPAQFYGQDINSYSQSRELGIDPLTQHSLNGLRFNNTVEFLQRKHEADNKRRELQERQLRRSDNDMTSASERLLDYYFNRRSSKR
jgi:hypothetical protein